MAMKLMVKQVQTSITFIFQDSEDKKNVIQVVKTYKEETDNLGYDVYKFNNDKNVYEKLSDKDSVEIVNALFKTNFSVKSPEPLEFTEAPPGIETVIELKAEKTDDLTCTTPSEPQCLDPVVSLTTAEIDAALGTTVTFEELLIEAEIAKALATEATTVTLEEIQNI